MSRDATTQVSEPPSEFPTRLLELDYVYLGTLGRGGTAMVFRASNACGNRQYAVKVLHPHWAARTDLVDALRGQGKLLAQLSGIDGLEQLVTMHELEHGVALVLDYIDGPTLEEVLDAHLEGDPAHRVWRGRPLAAEAVHELAVGLARPLRSLHDHHLGVTHHDVKPGNIMMSTRSGAVQLIDLGFARARWQVVSTTGPRPLAVLNASAPLGFTWHFAAPEQMRHGECTPAADMWAWAATIFAAATGRLPFGDTTGEAYRDRVLSGDVPPRIDQLPLALAAPMRELIRRGLERDPTRRPHAAEVVQRLDATNRPTAPLLPTQSAAAMPPRRPVLGREAERAALAMGLVNGTITIVHGHAGMGKSTLVAEAAWNVHDRGEPFTDGVRWVDLARADTDLDGDRLAQWLLREIDADAATTSNPETALHLLRHVLDTRRLLVALENLEAHAEATESILHALGGVRHSAIVATTTRAPVALPHWREVHLTELDPGSSDHPDTEPGAAVRFFVEIASLRDPAFEVKRHRAVVREICTRLAGLPFAIALVAQRVRAMSLESMRDHLDELAVSDDPRGGRDPRHASCAAAVNYTLVHASPAAQRALPRMAVLTGDADFSAIAAICNGKASRASTIETLVELHHASLIMRRTVKVNGRSVDRYHVPPLVRRVVEGRLEPAFLAEVRRLHLAHVLSVVRAAPRDGSGQLGAAWAALADVEASNLRQALEIAHERGDAGALGELFRAISVWWGVRRPVPEALGWAIRVAESTLTLGAGERMRVLNACGQVARDVQDAERAAHWFSEAITIAESSPDAALAHALLLTNLGLALVERDDHESMERSARLHRESRERCLALGHQVAADMAALNLAVVDLFRGSPDSAAEVLAELLPRLEAVPPAHADLRRIATAHELVGIIAAQRGDLEAGERSLRQAVRLQNEIVGDRMEIMVCLFWLGVIARRSGDSWRGRTLISTACHWFDTFGSRLHSFHRTAAAREAADTDMTDASIEPISDYDRAIRFALAG